MSDKETILNDLHEKLEEDMEKCCTTFMALCGVAGVDERDVGQALCVTLTNLLAKLLALSSMPYEECSRILVEGIRMYREAKDDEKDSDKH